MSKLEEYRAFAASERGRGVNITTALADAAIAELEATLAEQNFRAKQLFEQRNELKQRAEQAEAERDDFQQRLLDELAKNALTPTGRDRLEQAEAENKRLRERLDDCLRGHYGLEKAERRVK
jgi:adenine C2-methylase RlmN of 23S rRNA A2503 and tRNA A37